MLAGRLGGPPGTSKVDTYELVNSTFTSSRKRPAYYWIRGQAKFVPVLTSTPQRGCMYLLAWIFIGVGVGWGSGRALQGKGYGRMMDILMGVGGAGAGEFSEAFRRPWRFRWAMATTMVGRCLRLCRPLT